MINFANRLTYLEGSKDRNIWKDIDLDSRKFTEKIIGRTTLRKMKGKYVEVLSDKIDASLAAYADLSLEIDLMESLNLAELVRKVLDVDFVFEGKIDISDYDKHLITYSLTRKAMLNDQVVDEFLIDPILNQNDEILLKLFAIYIQFAVDLLRNLFIVQIRDDFIVGWIPRFGKVRDLVDTPIAFAPCLRPRSRIYEEMFENGEIMELDERKMKRRKKTTLLNMIIDENGSDHQAFKLAFPKSPKILQNHSVKRFLLEEIEIYRKNSRKMKRFEQKFTILRRIFGRNRVVHMEKLKKLLILNEKILLDKNTCMEYIECLNPKLFYKQKSSHFCKLAIVRLILQTFVEIQKKLANIG